MYYVACRQFEAGKNVEETVKLVQHPVEMVQAWYEEYQKRNRGIYVKE